MPWLREEIPNWVGTTTSVASLLDSCGRPTRGTNHKPSKVVIVIEAVVLLAFESVLDRFLIAKYGDGSVVFNGSSVKEAIPNGADGITVVSGVVGSPAPMRITGTSVGRNSGYRIVDLIFTLLVDVAGRVRVPSFAAIHETFALAAGVVFLRPVPGVVCP